MALMVGKDTSAALNETTLAKEMSCATDLGCVLLGGIMTWLEGSSIVRNLAQVGWIGALLIILFMMSVSIILLNILIAQLSLTYEMVQEESLHSFTALRMQAVSTIEWQSRFKFWNLRKKYYVPGELKTREEIKEMMDENRKNPDVPSPMPDDIWHVQEQIDVLTENVSQEMRKESPGIQRLNNMEAELKQKEIKPEWNISMLEYDGGEDHMF